MDLFNFIQMILTTVTIISIPGMMSIINQYGTINSLKVEYNNSSNLFAISFTNSTVDSFYDRSFKGGYSGYFVEILGEDEEDFPGTPVDDYRFFNRALTAEEIQVLNEERGWTGN